MVLIFIVIALFSLLKSCASNDDTVEVDDTYGITTSEWSRLEEESAPTPPRTYEAPPPPPRPAPVRVSSSDWTTHEDIANFITEVTGEKCANTDPSIENIAGACDFDWGGYIYSKGDNSLGVATMLLGHDTPPGYIVAHKGEVPDYIILCISRTTMDVSRQRCEALSDAIIGSEVIEVTPDMKFTP